MHALIHLCINTRQFTDPKIWLGPIKKTGHVTLTTPVRGQLQLIFHPNPNTWYILYTVGIPVYEIWRLSLQPFWRWLRASKMKMGHVTLTTSLLRVIGHPYAGTWHSPPINKKNFSMSKMGWFGVVRGHSRSLEMTQFDRAHTFHGNYVPILHRFWDIARYLSKIADFNLRHLYLAPQLGVTRLNFALWRQETRVSGLSHGVVCVSSYMFSSLSRLPTCGKRTDTKWQHIPC